VFFMVQLCFLMQMQFIRITNYAKKTPASPQAPLLLAPAPTYRHSKR